MSDPRLATIGDLLGGAPEHLVERSAAARAEAQGVALEEVLNAWSGGGQPVAGAAAVSEPKAAPVPPPVPPSVPEPVVASADPVAVIPEVAAVAVEVIEEDATEPIEPAPLVDRIRLGARVGAVLGAALGLLIVIVEAPLLLGRLSETTAAGDPAVEVTWTAVVATAAVWSVVGSIITLASRGAGRFRSLAYDTVTTPLGSVFSGGFIGLVLGSGLGGVMFATAEPSLSGTKLIAISPLNVLGVVAAASVLGAAIGGVGQALAQPAVLVGEEADDADTVRRRLSDALLLPIVATVVIAVIAVSLGSLLLRFSGFAPLIAILVAIATLGFAAMMASRPNLRVTKGEVLVAAAGVGVVLLMLALIAASITGGEGEEEVPADHARVQNVRLI